MDEYKFLNKQLLNYEKELFRERKDYWEVTDNDMGELRVTYYVDIQGQETEI